MRRRLTALVKQTLRLFLFFDNHQQQSKTPILRQCGSLKNWQLWCRTEPFPLARLTKRRSSNSEHHRFTVVTLSWVLFRRKFRVFAHVLLLLLLRSDWRVAFWALHRHMTVHVPVISIRLRAVTWAWFVLPSTICRAYNSVCSFFFRPERSIHGLWADRIEKFSRRFFYKPIIYVCSCSIHAAQNLGSYSQIMYFSHNYLTCRVPLYSNCDRFIFKIIYSDTIFFVLFLFVPYTVERCGAVELISVILQILWPSVFVLGYWHFVNSGIYIYTLKQ